MHEQLLQIIYTHSRDENPLVAENMFKKILQLFSPCYFLVWIVFKVHLHHFDF